VILTFAPRFIWWMTPVLAGLLLSAFLTMISSRTDLGLALRRWGLLLTPEESSPPPELALLQRAMARQATAALPAASDAALGVRGDTQQTPTLAPLRMEPQLEYRGAVPPA
jgi:membrane glycosyltransferase